VAVSDFDYRLRTQWESATLLGMESSTHRKPQPGWTGTRALRIVQATSRTFLSVDPIGRRSAVATLRSAIVSSWRSRLRLLPPVSVTLRDIETGGANLAQCLYTWAFQRSNLDAKVPETASAANHALTLWPTSDSRSLRRSSRGVKQSAWSLTAHLPSCFVAAARPGDTGLARPALHSRLLLSDCRIDSGRSRWLRGRETPTIQI
jgi:hypothetical protein